MRAAVWTIVALTHVLAFGLPALGVQGASEPPAGDVSTVPLGGGGGGGGAHVVRIGEVVPGPAADYTPLMLTVQAGQRTVFHNVDILSTPHTATADDGAFDTGLLLGGQYSDGIILDTPGTYEYLCQIHPLTMQFASITVE